MSFMIELRFHLAKSTGINRHVQIFTYHDYVIEDNDDMPTGKQVLRKFTVELDSEYAKEAELLKSTVVNMRELEGVRARIKSLRSNIKKTLKDFEDYCWHLCV